MQKSISPPLSFTRLRFFHSIALALRISIVSRCELLFVPGRLLRPNEPLLSPQTKSDSVTSSAKHSRMSKIIDNWVRKNLYHSVKWFWFQKLRMATDKTKVAENYKSEKCGPRFSHNTFNRHYWLSSFCSFPSPPNILPCCAHLRYSIG